MRSLKQSLWGRWQVLDWHRALRKIPLQDGLHCFVYRLHLPAAIRVRLVEPFREEERPRRKRALRRLRSNAQAEAASSPYDDLHAVGRPTRRFNLRLLEEVPDRRKVLIGMRASPLVCFALPRYRRTRLW